MSTCTDKWKCTVLMLHFRTSSPSPFATFHLLLFHFLLFLLPVHGLTPTGGKWVTPLHSLNTIAFDTQWWERERKGCHSTAAFGAAGAGAPAALKWMQPLMVKSIWDGDSVARLYTVTIADYNSTRPLPQHSPPPHSLKFPSLLCLLDEVWGLHKGLKGWGWGGEVEEGDFTQAGWI